MPQKHPVADWALGTTMFCPLPILIYGISASMMCYGFERCLERSVRASLMQARTLSTVLPLSHRLAVMISLVSLFNRMSMTLLFIIYLGSAELLSVHRQRVADVDPHSDDNDEKPPYFGQDKTKFPQELHHVFDEVAHSHPASCCIWKLGSYVISSIDSLASTE